mmetsp:Transcript_13357/g.48634  ORF Transcript_13357/g.48634 Transcript_13357/m.48634 type:complete len:95 (-) Transcript_13357:2869-3153(-)
MVETEGVPTLWALSLAVLAKNIDVYRDVGLYGVSEEATLGVLHLLLSQGRLNQTRLQLLKDTGHEALYDALERLNVRELTADNLAVLRPFKRTQ